ncbi:FAD-binding domain-containing protein [Hellea balneolensis]|uniref:FAD-binding domain-containing protein n=1 Tax=Hellea balneolensis TaxID=287478 RepID=UPI0003FC9471|nr:FAD-binding domain-containing protein [Hellea balneolensis]
MTHNPYTTFTPVKTTKSYESAVAVKALSPWADGEASPIRGDIHQMQDVLSALDPLSYSRTRNHLGGAVTQLSPFIRHGALTLDHVRNLAIERAGKKDAEKFVQQLTWRDYWQRLYRRNPDMIWDDVEAYKTGFSPNDYADELPEDVLNAQTGTACIDQFLEQLMSTGWIHNHARLYLAAYICHWRRVKWQVGAKFFLTHLLDGDPASNNLSWQWVASTFSHKPYFFNLDNVAKYSGADINTKFNANKDIAGSYEALAERLFPYMEPRR